MKRKDHIVRLHRADHIVSFYNTTDELLKVVPKGKRSQVINAALKLFLMEDEEFITLTREEVIRLTKVKLGLGQEATQN